MSELRRLLDGGRVGESATLDDWEHAVLRSARVDAPSAGARHRTLIALGVAAGGVTLAAATTAAGASAATSAATTTTTVTGAGIAKAATGLALLKWVGVGVTAGAVALGAAHYASHAPTRAADVTPTSPARLASGPVASGPVDRTAVSQSTAPVTPAAEPPAPAVEPATTPLKVSPSRPSPTLESPPSPPSNAAASPRLADEIALLDAARSALAAGDARDALAELDRHDRAFPDGPLAPESAVLRVEALAAQGDDTAALAAARAFLAANPGSPHERRVRAVADGLRAKHANPH